MTTTQTPNTTTQIISRFRTVEALTAINTEAYTVNGSNESFTITFQDADAALAAIEKAKNTAWMAYLKAGGNPRNKRSHGTQFAAVKRAIATR
jgi:hypothetical protein